MMKTKVKLTSTIIIKVLMIIGIISITKSLDAQCGGDVTLTTQAEVDAFSCSNITGNLIIEGSDINDLDAIATGSGFNLSIGGDIIVRNCPNLSSLEGIDIVTGVGGRFVLENLPSVTTMGGFNFSLSSCRELNISSCPALILDKSFIVLNNVDFFLNIEGLMVSQDLSGQFSNLTFAPNIRIFGNNGLQGLPNFSNLTNSASIVISNNTNSILSGFTGITSMSSYTDAVSGISWDGHIFILNNQGDTNLSLFPNLETTIGQILIKDNFTLFDIDGFSSLTSVGSIFIEYNTVLSISGFSNLASAAFIKIFENNAGVAMLRNNVLPGINGFNSLTSLSTGLDISNNIDLISISGFSNLSTCPSLLINQNTFLNNVTGFNSISSINTFTVTSNPQLSECCWMLDIMDIANNTTISSNGIGCSAPAEVGGGAPVMGSCPSGPININTNPGSCVATYNVTAPTVTDDCEVSSYINGLFDSNNNLVLDENVTSGQDISVDIEVGTWTMDFVAGDLNNNFTDCAFTIIVSDNETPEWITDTEIFVNAECGDDLQGILDNLELVASDNCEVTIFQEVSSSGNSCGNAKEYMYVYKASDNAGNLSPETTVYILMDDNRAPVLSGIPADVTISCGDDFPSMPIVTATDICQGDLSASVVMETATEGGSCGNGVVAETHIYTYSVADGCGNTTEEEWKVTVVSDFSFSLGSDIIVCEAGTVALSPDQSGDTYLWSTGATSETINVSAGGTYTLTITTGNGCCYTDEIEVTYSDVPNASAQGGVITCSASSVQISGSSTSSGVSYSWSGPGGFSSTIQNPMVSSLGTYLLTVSDANGCTSTASAEVEADDSIPEGTATGGIISCTEEEVTLMASSTTAGVSYSWSGPSAFSSSMQNPTVTVPGTYEVVVSATNGCTVEIAVEVIDDTGVPEIVSSNGELTCAVTAIDLDLTVDNENYNYSWTGPGGFSSDEKNPTVSDAGTYEVVVTGNNGCSSSAEVMITLNNEAPQVSGVGGTIDCSNSTVTIVGSLDSGVEGTTIMWSGPGGFSSSESSVEVSEIGTYTLTASSPNGCNASVEVEVLADENLPEVSATGGTIECGSLEVTLTASSTTAGVAYSWMGPDGFTSDEQNPSVETAGTYTVTVLAENGCSAQANALVVFDAELPEITVENGTIDCNNEEIELGLETDDVGLTYSWSGPDGYSSDKKNPTVSNSGTYEVIATALNGCEVTDTVVIAEDLDQPTVEATGATLSCDSESVTISGSITSSIEGTTASWSGPGGFFSLLNSVEVDEIGIYTYTALAPNGCSSSIEVEVEADQNLPDISASGGAIGCDNSEVELMGSTETTGASIMWTGPNGFSSEENNPTVSEIGSYTFTVTSENGCQAKSTVQVISDINPPVVIIKEGDVDCDASFILISAESEDDLEYSWTGPNGFNSEESEINISVSGTYTVTYTGSNGCEGSKTYILESDIAFEPNITTTPDTSETGGSAMIEIVGGTGPFSIVWDNGIQGNATEGLDMGSHLVTVVDGNGCIKTFTFNIEGSSSVIDLSEMSALQVYPNPVSSFIQMRWRNLEIPFTEINIYNIQGQLLRSQSIDNLQDRISIDCLEYKSGTYVIHLISKEGIAQTKFLKI